MTTSPFGTPVPAEPTPAAPEPTRSRRPLLFALGGVAAVAVLGAGTFLVLTGGEDEVVVELQSRVEAARQAGKSPSKPVAGPGRSPMADDELDGPPRPW